MAGGQVTSRSDHAASLGVGVSLADFLAAHGPLAPQAALVVALQLCADASALSASQLGRSIASIQAAYLNRDVRGHWSWRPAPTSALDRRPTDNEIAGRIGAVLFECLTGTPLPDYLPEAALVRSRLRELRPDLSQAIVDLTAQLASARSREQLALDTIEADLRRALGVNETSGRLALRGAWGLAAAMLVAAAVGTLWLRHGDPEGRVEAHGLTRAETLQSDIVTESADFWAASGEYITSFDNLQTLDRIWRARVAPDDPRIIHVMFRDAWARRLRGDFLTAEQSLTASIGPLERALGPLHPYLRATRLNLAGVLDRRGAAADAYQQRELVRKAARTLLPVPVASSLEEAVGPPAPGVLAHQAPHAPEREWFRILQDGSYFAPLTSTARWLAGQNGWRLHLTATDACDAAVDVGRDLSRVGVALARADDGWRLRVDGIRPPLDLRVAGSEAGPAHVTLDASPGGDLRVTTSDAQPLQATLDPGTQAPPPYGLTFASPSGPDGCALVWWEVAPRVE